MSCLPAKLRKKLKLLPNKPGVYIFKSKVGKVIYVGKAKSLKKRVNSYFTKPPSSPKVSSILEKLANIEYIVTSSELEAIILESNLIKKYWPRYNVILRDDKQYPYLKLTVNEEWPRLILVRRIEKDGARYFGPYSGGMVREMIRLIKRLFPIRWCKETPMKMRKQPCMYFHIRKCVGPCIRETTRQRYMRLCDEIITLLEGRLDETAKILRKEMQEASERLEFERAKAFRERAKTVERMAEGQKVVSSDLKDRDVVAFSRIGDKACAMVFQIRKGKLVGREMFFPTESRGVSVVELMTNVALQYYTDAAFIPPEIILQYPIEKPLVFKKWLSKQAGRKVSLEVQRKGRKQELVSMAEENARILLERKALSEAAPTEASGVTELKEKLNLSVFPVRIEAFDISNISGKDIVGSMVAFVSGAPYKRDYRRFEVRTVKKQNDVSAIYEVVRRRYSGSLSKELGLPDLILIDGGIGQVRAGNKALQQAGIFHIPIVGLAKRFEDIYFPHRTSPIKLRKESKALQLLQRVRNEAHRFALAYHKLKRKKKLISSRK